MNKKHLRFVECAYVLHEDEEGNKLYCERNAYGGGRGLCQAHYVNARYHVREGHTTWEQIEKKGLCRKKLTQAEKNELQRHPHSRYNNSNRQEAALKKVSGFKNDF